MSTYRGYVPWKSTLTPGYQSKTDSGSRYSSRDDVSNTENKTQPRFGSLTSPSTFRPSYSGGTYRSAKRESTPTTPTNTTTTKYSTTPTSTATTKYGTSTANTATTKYGTTNAASKEPSKEKDEVALKKYATIGSKLNLTKSTTPEVKSSRFLPSTNSSNDNKTSKYASTNNTANESKVASRYPSTNATSNESKVASRYPSTNATSNESKVASRYPSTNATSNESKVASRYPSTNATSNESKVASRYSANSATNSDAKTSKYSSTSNLCTKQKLRDPSPVIERRSTTLNVASIRSRDTSPAAASLYLRSRSRDPSPAESIRSRYTSPLRNYSNSYNMLKPRKNVPQLGSTLGPALSYMTASEVTARNKTRREKFEREKKDLPNESETARKHSTEKENRNLELEDTVLVNVVTRGTSPSPPNAPVPANYVRARRVDLAKTIEKTILRSVKKRPCADKEVQSDRLDDTTKYSRFKNSRIASWTSFLDNSNNKTNSTPNSTTSRSSASSSSSSSKSEAEKKKTKEMPAISKSSSLSKSSSSKSVSKEKLDKPEKAEKLKSTLGEIKLKTPSKSSSSSLSSKKSVESSHQLPPLAPKGDSPAKSAAALSECAKWTNKDFRKSALNVGPSDRPRKNTTSSADSESEGTEKINYRLQGRTERSPSASSTEVSSSSTSSTSNQINGDETKSKSLSSRASYVNKEVDHTPNSQVLEQLQDCTSSNDPSAKSSADANIQKISSFGQLSSKIESKSSHSIQDECYEDENNSTSISESLERDTENPYLAPTYISNEKLYDPNRKMPLNEFETNASIKLRHIDSGELPWWMNDENDDDDDTLATDITLNQSDIVDLPAENRKYKIRHIESGEKAWWLRDSPSGDTSKSSTNIPADPSKTSNHIAFNGQVNEISKSSSISIRDSPSKSASRMFKNTSSSQASKAEVQEPTKIKENTPPINRTVYRIRHIESGEKAWWMTEGNETETAGGISKNYSANKLSECTDLSSKNITKETSSSPKTVPKYKIRHIESGEKAWWMQDEGQPNQDQICSEIKTIDQNNLQNSLEEANDMLPLGDRASPEGLEAPTKRSSLCENENNSDQILKKLFISRHTNIDDLLGGSSHPLSPLLVDCFAGKDQFEKITPDQVKIHEGFSAMQEKDHARQQINRNLRNAQPVSNKAPMLDDASIQVYKDGDYGAYLDLESSLAEQIEDIEGLQSSRKNSLVVRTQLSVRVHTIIEKLLTSKGRDLRRALFSLKQIFQEDKDLVHGFVALGGLNCLVRVGSGADQNYQNYILRALGQVMLYVDGMNGVMKHGPTIQWLYTLIASKYRMVVKTALKLLLVFVEYVESNSYLLVNAIHTVDFGRGLLPWSNIMKLLKDYESSDTELLIYATSLINKTLSGLSDQDSFYDESDFLEQQGMESVVQRHMCRPGTDFDLLDQLQVYEEVLKFEDGETDGICIPDNSIRKTLRYRANNYNGLDTNERRKSRRHSTGNSPIIQPIKSQSPPVHQTADEDSSSSANSGELSDVFNVAKTNRESAGVTPGLRRRRERVERQKTFMKEQQEAASAGLRTFENREDQSNHEATNEDKKLLLQLKRDHTVKDLTQKLSNLPMSPQEEKPNRIGDMTGLISKAKEGLAKSKSKGEISRSPSVDQDLKKSETKKSENELHWEELVQNMERPLILCDLDFTDLQLEDDKDNLAPRGLGGSVPPPPPPIGGGGFIAPPPMNFPPPLTNLPPPQTFNYMNGTNTNDLSGTIKKNKKTVKLFWKEVRDDLPPVGNTKTIWDELPETTIDVKVLEHLFESRAKDLMARKQQDINKNKEIIVLDHKRSNAINIAMTKLPPPRAIKAAILKMDATVVTREGIEKLLNMLPTDEERGKIQEAQVVNPELPLGSAEQFLLTLSSISELAARLKLWAFKLDFEISEKEIAEPLMDLKQGVETLRNNKTFKSILSTLLSIGIFLNGAPVKGFQIEYLAKVPEVKDTVHKHSLLHHLCHMVMDNSPQTTDLYSEIGPVTRASKADFADLAHNIAYLEKECKASWDRLKLIAKHDCPPQLKQKLIDFLADCAERIIILDIVHRRVINRYRKFLLWLGVPQHRILESRPNEVCRIISEFALEYRTTRERVQQQIEKKANHRERNKTRGKMIIDVAKIRTQEDRADAELKQILGSPNTTLEKLDQTGTLTWRRRRNDNIKSPKLRLADENLTDGDDELLETLVKTATKATGPRQTPRERKRTRHADRKSLRRTLKNGITEEELQHAAEVIKNL